MRIAENNPLRRFGRPPRIMGLDVARALAVIGMVGAHMGEFGEIDIWQPSTYFGIAHGRSSILFAVLAGVSVALMTGRTRIPERERMPVIRLQLFARGTTIFLIGLFCELLGAPVAVILTFYGLLYVAIMPFLRMRIATLVGIALGLALFGPMLMGVLEAATADAYMPGANLVLFGTYPLSVWLPLMLVGLAIGRLRLDSNRVAAALLGVGAAVSGIAYALSAVLGGGEGASVAGPYSTEVEDYWGLGDILVRSLVASYPHSGGTLEIFGSGGFAIATIGLCLLLAKPLRWLLIPLAALGAMPLTAYTGHLVIMVLVWGPGNLPESNAAWGWTALGLIVGCTLLMLLLGRGPLEQLVKYAAEAAVGRDGEAKPGDPRGGAGREVSVAAGREAGRVASGGPSRDAGPSRDTDSDPPAGSADLSTGS